MSDPKILERNLSELLRRAYIPVRPSAAFQRKLSVEYWAAWENARHRRQERSAASPAPARPLRSTPYRMAIAAVACAAAVLLWTLLDTSAPAPSTSVEALLANGQVAIRTSPDGDFEAANGNLVHSGQYLECITPAARAAQVQAGTSQLVAQAGTHLILEDTQRAQLDRGGLLLESDSSGAAPWNVRSAPGTVALHSGRLSAQLEGLELVVRLDEGEAYALVPSGPERLPLGESRLRAGELVGVLSAALSAPTDTGSGTRNAIDTPLQTAIDEESGEDTPTGLATLSGVVLSPEGVPVGEFEVLLLIEQDYANVTDPERRSFEASDGRFEWTGIDPGTYDLYVSAPDFAQYKGAESLQLGADASAQIEVRLEPEAILRGMVIDGETGLGVPDAVVVSEADVPLMALPIADTQALAKLGHLTRTRPDGSFELRRLSSGIQLLRVTAPGYAPTWSERFELTPAQKIEGELFELGPEARVSGHVYGADGRPQADIALVAAIVDNSGKRFCMSFAQTLTDFEGRYTMGGLPPEFGVVVNLGQDFSAPPQIQPMQLVAEEEQQIDFGIPAVGARVFGKVSFADGRTASAMPISIAPAGLSNAFSGWQAGSTDADGTYSFEGVQPGAYDFFVSYGMVGSVTRVAGLQVPEWHEIENDIVVPLGTLRGNVTRASDGAPALFAIAIVEALEEPSGALGEDAAPSGPTNLQPNRFIAKAMTNQDGSYAVEHLKPGRYRITIYSTADALGSVLETVTLDETVLRRDYALPPGAWPTLYVAAADGRPVPGARVKVYDVETEIEVLWNDAPYTDAQGVLQLSPSSPTLVRVEIYADGYQPHVTEHHLTVGEQELHARLQQL